MFESQYNIYRNRTSIHEDKLPEELKNTFVVNFQTAKSNNGNNGNIDNRIRVRLTPQSVRFIYIDEKAERRGDSGVVVYSISITSPKETGNDLLFFENNINVPEALKDSENLIPSNFKDTSKKIFSNFPCVYSKENETSNDFSDFLKVCLLSFLFEFEIRESVFGTSPLYDEVRKKLRESKVYLLLCAKVKYDMLLYKWKDGGMDALDKDEYNYIVHCYADLLMDNEYNKIVPPYYFDGKGWLYDPETELEGIVDDDRKLSNLLRKSDDSNFEQELKDKIRNYFYTKHAVWSAQLSKKEKIFYRIAQGIMIVFTLLSGVAMLFFKEPRCEWFTNWYFSSFWLIASSAVLGVLLSLIIGAHTFNVFLPRIIVSVAIMWLMTFISEDLIKSQILIDKIWVLLGLACVLFCIVVVLLYGEIKQHSPYTSLKYGKRWLRKCFCILNYFIFVVGIFGMMMQLLFYKDLLKGSQALPEIVYESDYYQPLEVYKSDLGCLQKSIDDYREFSWYISSHIKPIETSSTQRVLSEDSLYTAEFKSVIKTQSKVQLAPAQSDYYKIVDEFNENINNIITLCDSVGAPFPDAGKVRNDSILSKFYDSIAIKKDFSLLKKNDTIVYIWSRWLRNEQCKVNEAIGMNDYDTLLRWATYLSDTIKKPILSKLYDSIAIKKDFSLLKKNDTIVYKWSRWLRNEQCKVDAAIQMNDYDTLLRWATYLSDTITKPQDYVGCLKNKAMQSHNVCRDVGKSDNPPKIFPHLLLIHSLIVLILAFIGQLFLTKETVSEPL